MTEERKIGGNRWTDFVKEYAQAHNVSYMCASTNPEVKAEWKKRKGAEKTPKAPKAAKAPKAPKAPKLTHEQVVEKALAKAKETVPSVPKVKGRPKKYATPEEAHRAKLEKTKISVQKKRAAQPKKRGQVKPLDNIEMKAFLAKSKEDLDQLQTLVESFLKDHPVPSLDEKDKKRIFHHIRVLDDKKRELGLIPPLGRGRKPKKTDENITLTMTEVPASMTPSPAPTTKKRGRPKKAKVSAPVPTGFEGQGYSNGEAEPMGETRPKRTGGMDPTFPPSFRPSPSPSSIDSGPWYLDWLFLSFGGTIAMLCMSCGALALASLSRAVVQQFRGWRMMRDVVPVADEGEPELQEIQLHDPIAEWAREFNVPRAAANLLRDHLAHAVRIYPIDQAEDTALEAIQDVREHPEEFFQLAREALPFAEEVPEATDVRPLRRDPFGELFDPHDIPSVPEPVLVHPEAPAEQEPDEPSGRGRKGGRRKKGLFDFLDPKKNGVAKAFDPKQNGVSNFFENDVKNALQENIRPIIHGAVGTAISGLTGVPLLGTLIGQAGLNEGINQGLDKANLGFGRPVKSKGKTEDARVFKNYGKIQSHLAEHLGDLREPIDPKDLRDFIYFTRERDRLKHKLVGGRSFFDKIGDAFKTTWNQKPQSKAETDALKFFYNDFLPVASAPINIIAPPVGKISNTWFNELKDHQLGQGRRRG